MNKVEANRALNVNEVKAGRISLESKPLQMNVELTGVCDVNPPCVFCSGKNVGYNYRPMAAAYLDKYADFLDRCERVNEDSFGEPLTHPQLVDVARRFTGSGQSFSFVSNGLTLRPELAESLAECGPNLGMHISFNAATADTYYKLTGREFSVLVDNVGYFVRAYRERNDGAAPNLTLTFIVMKINRHEVADFLHLVDSLGVNALLAMLHDRPSVPLGDFGYDFVYGEEMLPFEEYKIIGEEARRLSNELGLTLKLQWDPSCDSAVQGFSEPNVEIPCLIPWRFLYLQEHSKNVYACPYHTRPMGNLASQSLEEVWNGEEAQAMRGSLAKGEIPKFCWNNSAACPVIHEAKHRGFDKPVESVIVMGKNDYWHLGRGWHSLEEMPEPARWTSDRASFKIRTGRRSTLCFEWACWKPSIDVAPVFGYLELEGRMLRSFSIGRVGWQIFRTAVPQSSEERIIDVKLWVSNHWRPSEEFDEERDTSIMEVVFGMPETVKGSRDTRQLGVQVRKIWIEEGLLSRLRARFPVERHHVDRLVAKGKSAGRRVLKEVARSLGLWRYADREYRPPSGPVT